MIQGCKFSKDVGMFKARDGDWVKFTDHKAINELVEVLEKIVNDHEDRIALYLVMEGQPYKVQIMGLVKQAIAKAKEV
jgi:hypothetical protein